MRKMYPAIVNSPKTEITEAITQAQTDISVTDSSVLLPGEGIAVIGNGETAETITYTSVEGNTLKGCLRGYQGVARAWTPGTRVARNFAAADWDAARENILELADRLDTPERAAITLQPGIHVVQADQDAAFKLAGLQGRTVLNYQSQVGIFGVLNPYVIRYGTNLIPPFYEWGNGAVSGSTTVDSPFRLKMVKGSGVTGFNTLSVRLNVAPLTQYTLAMTVDMSNIGGTITAGVYWNMESYNEAGQLLEDYTQGPFVTTNGIKTLTRTFTAPTNASYVRVVLGMDNGTTGTAVFRDVQLNVGSSTKPFTPREEAMLALQTELHANPNTGDNPDMVFERDGQYCKLAMWRKVVLDGSLSWTLFDAQTGTKRLFLSISGGVSSSNTVVKFDGSVLKNNVDTYTTPDSAALNSSGMFLNVKNSDTGWGDSYTNLTAEEIKAYFMGWRMFTDGQDALTNTYNGSGTKKWVKIGYTTTGSIPIDAYSSTLPTTLGNVNGTTPYQLLYQLATPVVEPITSEGQLTLIEGVNQVEVGTGIVLHESAKPQMSDYGTYINSAFPGFEQTKLKYRTSKILTLFKNEKFDPSWARNTLDAYGLERAVLSAYDPSAAYSVTYLMLEKYPAADFTGTYAENEKALLLDTVRTLRENTTRISVLESKKAEKDAPAWITPTLLNGWVNFTGGLSLVGYYKDSMGYVHLRGVIKPGVMGSSAFILPSGYRPTATQVYIVAANTDNTNDVLGRLNITSAGAVIPLNATGTNITNSGWASLENIPPFLGV